jgi:hypothetical protein
MKQHEITDGTPRALYDPVTPEEIEAASAYRARVLADLPAGPRLSADEKAQAGLVKRERWLLAQIHAAGNSAQAAVFARALGENLTGRPDLEEKGALADVLVAECERLRYELGQVLFRQGRFAEAARENPDLTDLCERYEAAAARDDAEFCDCTAADGILPRQIKRGRMYSERHGDFVNIVSCGCCDALNLTPGLPPALEVLDQMRSDPALRAKDRGPDSDLLKKLRK